MPPAAPPSPACPQIWRRTTRLFIGFPVWWYVEPRIVDTFLESGDLAGKTLIPFATSGDSGHRGGRKKSLQAHCPAADWKKGKTYQRRSGELGQKPPPGSEPCPLLLRSWQTHAGTRSWTPARSCIRPCPSKRSPLGVIGEKTSFSRTSIYNYFQTKEEIFLALLRAGNMPPGRDDLCRPRRRARARGNIPRDVCRAPRAARVHAQTHVHELIRLGIGQPRRKPAILQAGNTGRSLRGVEACLRAHFPRCGQKEAERFVYAFFPFLFGVYPYTQVTPKQAEAMERAHIAYPRPHRRRDHRGAGGNAGAPLCLKRARVLLFERAPCPFI